MKRMILVLTVLALSLPMMSVVADLDGVRGIPWGAGPDKVKTVFQRTDARIVEKGDYLEILPRTGPVSRERYYFTKGRLFKVSMAYTLTAAKVLDYFTDLYGRPDFEKNAFWWKFPSTLAKIEKGSATIWYRSREISDAEDGKKPETPEDPHQNITRVNVGMSVANVTDLMGQPIRKRSAAGALVIFTYRTGEIFFREDKVTQVKLFSGNETVEGGPLKRKLNKQERME